jgi:HSP20 family molecular chaperone IbpA
MAMLTRWDPMRDDSKNGILAVQLPKKPEAKPRSIPIKVT